jgi:hypothetical protein
MEVVLREKKKDTVQKWEKRRNRIVKKGAVTYAKAHIQTVCYSLALALTFPIVAITLHLVPGSCRTVAAGGSDLKQEP